VHAYLYPRQTPTEDTKAVVARQRWVLAQILPPCEWDGSDIFVEVLRAVQRGDTDISNTLDKIKSTNPDFFPRATRLFVVIDK
jgi:hypothetical protein